MQEAALHKLSLYYIVVYEQPQVPEEKVWEEEVIC